jgi:hypothetical protein
MLPGVVRQQVAGSCPVSDEDRNRIERQARYGLVPAAASGQAEAAGLPGPGACRGGIPVGHAGKPAAASLALLGLGGVTADALGIQAVYILGGVLLLLAAPSDWQPSEGRARVHQLKQDARPSKPERGQRADEWGSQRSKTRSMTAAPPAGTGLLGHRADGGS